MQRADCDAHSSRRICGLPITILLADRFSRISAPAAAPAALGGAGTQRSAQISIWNVNAAGAACPDPPPHAESGTVAEAAKIRSDPNGASCPATVIEPPRTPSPEVKC